MDAIFTAKPDAVANLIELAAEQATLAAAIEELEALLASPAPIAVLSFREDHERNILREVIAHEKGRRRECVRQIAEMAELTLALELA